MITPVQSRILKMLGDGKPHTKEEIHTCLEDDLAPVSGIRFHICNLRVILRRKGQGIVCEYANRKIFYRQVIFLPVGE